MALSDYLNKLNQLQGMQPQQSPIGMPPVGMSEKDQKNKNLAIMLYALGGALRGKSALETGLGLQQTLASQEQQKRREQQREQFLQQNPQYATQIAAIEAGIPKEFLTPKSMFEGQGTTNQFYNILLQGQKNESIRSTPQYKTAYDYLSQPKTETLINEQGQQVTRSIPGIISKQDYLPPTGVEVADLQNGQVQPPMADSMKTIDKDVVVAVSPERRKELKKNITVLDNTSAKLNTFLQKIEEIDPNVRTIGTERADIKNAYTSILLELKNLEELGVLAGPDLDLLQGMLGDPVGLYQNLFMGGAEGTKLQIQNIKDYIMEKKTRFSSELGEKIETPQGTTRQETAFLNGRQIIPNNDNTGWIYKDTGEPAQ